MSENWYDTGYDGVKKEEDRMNAFSPPRRFWVKVGEPKEFVFVSDEPFAIYEHNPKINGGFKNWITCVKGMYDTAPCCDEIGEQSRYYVGIYTVVDCSKFVSKNNTYQYELKFLPAKVKSMKKFKRKREDLQSSGEGGLVGKMYRAIREDSKSPNIGDEFEFVKNADMEKLFQIANFAGKKLPELYAQASGNAPLAATALERLQKTFDIQMEGGAIKNVIPQFNYLNLLKPKSPAELTYMLKGKVEKDDDSNGAPPSNFGNSDSVPF